MTDKKKRVILAVVFLICVAACIAAICVREVRNKKKATGQYQVLHETRFDWFYGAYEGKNGAVAMITKNDSDAPIRFWFGDRYLAGGKADYTQGTLYMVPDHVDLHTGELYLYDIYEKQIVKTIDYKEILDQYLPEDYAGCDYTFEKYGGSYWADIDISDYHGEGQEWKHVYLDPVTEEAYFVSIGEQMTISDIYEKKVLKTIDCKTILEEDAPGYEYYGSWEFCSLDGKNYFILGVTNKESDIRYVWIDLETETADCVLNSSKETPDGSAKEVERSLEWRAEIYGEENAVDEFLSQKGLSSTDGVLEKGEYFTGDGYLRNGWYREEGTFFISILWSSIAKDSDALEAYFPGLKDYEPKDDDMVTVFIPGYPGADEIIEVLRLLIR